MSEAVFWELRDRAVFRFTGADRKKFLNGLLTSDVLALKPGEGGPSCLLTPKGKLLADLDLYDGGDDLVAIVSAASAKNFAAAISKRIVLSESRMERLGAESAVYLLLGCRENIQGARAFPYERLGAPGCFLLAERSLTSALAGGARRGADAELEVLRVESGVPRFGVDMNEDSLPLEARLEDAISFTKGCYMGQETVARIKNLGHVNKILSALKCGREIAPGAVVSGPAGESGLVTSAVFSPRFDSFLALSTLRFSDGAPGTILTVGGGVRAEVVSLPRWA